MSASRRMMSAGLRAAYVEVLAPAAALAPLPLLFTAGASRAGLLAFEGALLALWLRARSGRPIRVPDLALNLAGLGYFAWLGFEVAVLRAGLIRSVSHLLLFTALAKLASLKTPGEARTALLVVFLLTLASASSSTHVSSLLYLAAMAFIGFRTLARLAVLADFEEAPPRRVFRGIPTRGMTAAALASAALLSAPLFYALPRLRGPYALAPFKLEDSLSTALTADRVDLEAFSSAKRSDRVVLRLTAEPADWKRVVRLREAVFTEYHDGIWTRASRSRPAPFLAVSPLPGRAVGRRVAIDLTVVGNGFLFLPYGASSLNVSGNRAAHPLPDGVFQLTTGARGVSYDVGLAPPAPPRGEGSGAIDPSSVPPEVERYAARIAGNARAPAAIYEEIRSDLARNFVYTLDPPAAAGDPIVHFLLRSRTGHCEFFASAAAMMLASRGVPARLVTGSYGGEAGFFGNSIVVRGGNLHAWVEANVDGRGFSVLDPTPPSGVPPATSRLGFVTRLAGLGRELEFFYDRRILGFEPLDQIRVIDAARESLAGLAAATPSWREALGRSVRGLPALAAAALLAGAAVLAVRRLRRAGRAPAATRAYVAVRRLLARRMGALSSATPPAEVARRLGDSIPAAADDAREVVALYCASVFGGKALEPAVERDLARRVKRLRRLR